MSTIDDIEMKRILTLPRTTEVIPRSSGDRYIKDIKLNSSCLVCGVKEVLPFKCSYCGGTFCGDHRLPHKHNCTYGVREIVITDDMLRELETQNAEPIYIPVIDSPVISEKPIKISEAWNPLSIPTPGVNPEIDEAIRDELIRLQRLYPGCADYLTLALVGADVPNGVPSNWLACAVPGNEKILLREDKWAKPFCMPTAEARDVITHEFGHFVFWKLDYTDINEWNEIWEDYKTADSITSTTPSGRYAFANCCEGFAEAFAAVEGFKYMSVNRTDPLFFGCKRLIKKHRSESF